MREPREYTAELKRIAVARVMAGEGVLRVARDLKIDRQRLYEWRRKFREGGMEALRGRGRPRVGAVVRTVEPGEDELSAATRRIAALERKIGQQQVDLDFFRRALRLVEETRRAPAGAGAAASTRSSKR